MNDSDKNFLTIKEASKILNVSRGTLRNWDNNNKLKAYRHPLNNYRVYKKEDIDKLLYLIQNNKTTINTSKNKSLKLQVEHLED